MRVMVNKDTSHNIANNYGCQTFPDTVSIITLLLCVGIFHIYSNACFVAVPATVILYVADAAGYATGRYW